MLKNLLEHYFEKPKNNSYNISYININKLFDFLSTPFLSEIAEIHKIYKTDPKKLTHDFEVLNNLKFEDPQEKLNIHEEISYKIQLLNKFLPKNDKTTLSAFAFELLKYYDQYNFSKNHEFAQSTLDLLLTQINKNIQNHEGNTLLHYEYIRKRKVFEATLLKHKVDFNIINNKGSPAIFYLLNNHNFHENINRIINSIEETSLPSIQDSKGCSFVHYLCSKNFPLSHIKKHLNSKNLGLLDKNQQNEFFHLFKNMKNQVSKMQEAAENLAILLDNNVNIHQKNINGRNVLIQGIIHNSTDFLEFLNFYYKNHQNTHFWEKFNLNLGEFDNTGQTVGHFIAAKITSKDIPYSAQCILEQTFHIKSQNQKILPLDLAIKNNNIHMIDYLAKLHNYPDLTHYPMEQKKQIIKEFREKEEIEKIITKNAPKGIMKL